MRFYPFRTSQYEKKNQKLTPRDPLEIADLGGFFYALKDFCFRLADNHYRSASGGKSPKERKAMTNTELHALMMKAEEAAEIEEMIEQREMEEMERMEGTEGRTAVFYFS